MLWKRQKKKMIPMKQCATLANTSAAPKRLCQTFYFRYGKGFGIIPATSPLYMPNSVYGLIFYALVAILGMFNKYSISTLVITLGVCSNLGSIYLAYILYILNNVCVVCVSTYLVNAFILILAVKKHRKLFQDGTNKKKKKKKKSE
ncbi:vitamin-K epoxide reductase isoform X2 [Augochlora pura]